MKSDAAGSQFIEPKRKRSRFEDAFRHSLQPPLRLDRNYLFEKFTQLSPPATVRYGSHQAGIQCAKSISQISFLFYKEAACAPMSERITIHSGRNNFGCRAMFFGPKGESSVLLSASTRTPACVQWYSVLVHSEPGDMPH
jgi:hypothetical protein